MIASTSRTILHTIATRPIARGISATSTRLLSTTSATHLSLFGLFSRKPSSPKTSAAPSNKSDAASPASIAATGSSTVNSTTATPMSAATAKATSTTKDPAGGGKADQTQVAIKGKMLARDQELLAKLLDREGGSAGVSIVNGRYEEGLGPETKKNMFRLI